MNLHNVEAVEPVEPETTEGHCPCGSQSFTRMETGWKRERHSVDFTGHYPNEDWDVRDEGIDETDAWECALCGRIASDELEEWIENNR